jgi:SAM-dependent methyltransferase
MNMVPARNIEAADGRSEEARIQAAYERRKFAGKNYSWFEPGHLFMVQELERYLLDALKRHGMVPLRSKQILEIGCGNGHWLREFIKWGASAENLFGVDLLADRIAQACRLSAPGIRFASGNAAQLDFADESFDIVLQATVFTSILDDAVKQRIAGEMLRVLTRNGLVLWYDFRVDNPRNPDVRGIGKREIQRLFPGCRVALKRITLAPPLSLAPYSGLGSQLLSAGPWGCSHYFGSIQKA